MVNCRASLSGLAGSEPRSIGPKPSRGSWAALWFPMESGRSRVDRGNGEKPMSLAAGVRDLSTMLRPRSVALVGATDRSMWSRATFANLTTLKFDGEGHLVSRRGGTVHGRTAAPSCAALGEKIDLGLIMVPAAAIEEAMADLGAAGARNAVILTSGFAETGYDGATNQQKLAELANRFGISVLGPNCLGFVN